MDTLRCATAGCGHHQSMHQWVHASFDHCNSSGCYCGKFLRADLVSTIIQRDTKGNITVVEPASVSDAPDWLVERVGELSRLMTSSPRSVADGIWDEFRQRGLIGTVDS